MSTRLVILGLLRSQPLHGYEIKRTVEEHMGDWTSIAFGSIYFALEKLAQEGAIEVVATEKAGARPSRTVYAITERGEAEFGRLLREAWLTVERSTYAVDIALFFMDAMPTDEVCALLERRAAQLAETEAWVAQHRSETVSSHHIPPQAEAIFEHVSKHLAAEMSWTEETLRAVESGLAGPARPRRRRTRPKETQ